MKMLFSSAAYIQEHFRLDIFTEANNMNPDQNAPQGEQSDLGPFCLQYRLVKNRRREEQMTKDLTAGLRVNLRIDNSLIHEKFLTKQW